MIDFQQFARYSTSAPRYTSYPTAVEFKEDFDFEALKEAFIRNDNITINGKPMPLSLYLHLPFCRSACYFCGCNVIYTSKEDKKERYISYLIKELAILETLMNTKKEVLQLHFGGGTPTFFEAYQLEKIINLIYKHFSNFSSNAEISCEIDPRFFNREQMRILRQGGFNRLSFGVQDFDPCVQESIHRFQDINLVRSAVDLAREFGIKSINFDLIYGLPNQSVKSFIETLKKVVLLNPDRLAIFNYAHVPWVKKAMRKIDENALPKPKEKLEILEQTINFLQANGYEMIGMDHFAKPTDELFIASKNAELRRNFQGYTTRGFSQTIGIGLTSIGEGKDYYVQNFKDMGRYEAALDERRIPVERGVRLTKEDILRKDVIMGLMNNLKLEFKPFLEQFNIDFRAYFAKELRALSEYVNIGVLEINNNGIYTNPTGAMLFVILQWYSMSISQGFLLERERLVKVYRKILAALWHLVWYLLIFVGRRRQ